MEKTNESYVHKETGIKFDVSWNYSNDLDTQKQVKIIPSGGLNFPDSKGFVFNRSKVATIQKIATALLEIGNFVEKL
jgi:hypothetical protein